MAEFYLFFLNNFLENGTASFGFDECGAMELKSPKGESYTVYKTYAILTQDIAGIPVNLIGEELQCRLR